MRRPSYNHNPFKAIQGKGDGAGATVYDRTGAPKKRADLIKKPRGASLRGSAAGVSSHRVAKGTMEIPELHEIDRLCGKAEMILNEARRSRPLIMILPCAAPKRRLSFTLKASSAI
jgi:hypothetical protein